jgi:multidrug efflux pump subunit AcrA (membrane-fusion protein)
MRRTAGIRPRFRWLTAVVAFAALLAVGGCRSRSGADNAEGSPGPASPTIMAVTAAKVTVAPMHQELRLLGTTVALRHLTIRAPAAGRVLGLNLQSGDRVHRGEVVAHIINREVEAAENGLETARRIDPQEAPALSRAVKRYSTGAGIAVRAPQDAVVAQRIVSSGQMVADMDPLADLIDPRDVYVEAAVPVDNLPLVKPGMSASVTSPLHAGGALAARVAALSPSLSQGGATSPARIEFTGEERITQAEAPVEVRITTEYVPDAVTIAAAALFQDAANNSYYVFVAGADGLAHRTAVTAGIRTQSQVQITSGLKPGQIVITSGGYALSDGLKVNLTVAQN